ncbi:MAG: Gfo/Idh/MocA family oxidoreductase [Bryobacteraceae bacterium]
MTRREVVGAASAAMIVARHVLGGPGYQAPSDTLRIAGVGIGGMGRRYLAGCAAERITVLCDVDHDFAAPVFRKYDGAKIYRDYRVMFDKEANNIDAVIIGTPDHSHAAVTMRALKLGKHVYCAKPLTHNLYEAQMVRETAAAAKVSTQMSVQSCMSPEACATTEILMSGVLGPIREVHIWTPHPIYPAGRVRPTDTPPVPKGLDWDLWIGPAPYRPYHPAYHPWIWRAYWDFANGTIGDMMNHALHMFFKPLQLENPPMVHASRTTMHGGYFEMRSDGKETLPLRVPTPESESYSCQITWDYPSRGDLAPLRLHWHDGGMRPPRPLELGVDKAMPAAGVLFVGDKGKLMADYSGGRNWLLPEDRFAGFTAPKVLTPVPDHYKEWTTACKAGTQPSCNFAFGSRMTEVALLGALAVRTEKLLLWDSAARRITNVPQANALVNPPYRSGWTLF